VELTWWAEHTIEAKGFTFTSVPCQHWSRRGVFDTNKSLWTSWVVSAPRHRVFFSGDTGYCPVFEEIGRRFGPFDLALIPIGAYCPRWFMQPAHIDVGEAVQVHLDIGAKRSIGMHWGTFILTDEPIMEPPERLLYDSISHAITHSMAR